MSDLAKGYVVTGGGRGVGRAIVDRLLSQDAYIGIIERDEAALDWLADHPAGDRVIPIIASAADEAAASRAADAVAAVAPLVGWVNNAAIFRDAAVHEAPRAVRDLEGGGRRTDSGPRGRLRPVRHQGECRRPGVDQY